MIYYLRQKFASLDYILLGAVLLLIIIGLIMISSVSVFESYTVTQNLVSKGLREAPSNDFYLIRSLVYSVLAVFMGIVAFSLPSAFWEKVAWPLFGLAFLFLILTFTSYGTTLGGATAWLDIPGLPSLQPVEVYKLSLILYLASWLNRNYEKLDILNEGFVQYFGRVALFVIPLALQPDFGSILVIVPITMALYLVAGGSKKFLLYVVVSGLIVMLIAAMTFPYIRNRMLFFINPEADPTNRGIGWQIEQSLIAVGSGGAFGRGIGNSIQKFGYLPEVQSDTIFAAMAEELGFVRLLLILGIFVLVIYRGTNISLRNQTAFGALVTCGITIWIAMQTIVNIGVNLNLLPLTGLTLPFISYGGSSMVSLCVGVGILLSYSCNLSQVYENHFYRRGDVRARYTSTYSSLYSKRKR